MPPGHTHGAGAALSVAEARVDAPVADTRKMVGALGVQLTFTAFTRDERVADVSSWAGADGALGAGAVVSGRALGVRAARVRFAQVTGFKRPAEGEGITGHVPGAGADWGQAAEVALGIDTARADARIHARVVHTRGLVARALAVRLALGAADFVRVAVVAPWALADSAVGGNSLAVSIDAAVAARADALEVAARLLGAALAVRLALVTASR